MIDRFNGFSRGLTSPATEHFLIVPADGIDLPVRPRVIKTLTAGTLALRDEKDVIISYDVVAGELLQFSLVGVELTGTTATVVGWV